MGPARPEGRSGDSVTLLDDLAAAAAKALATSAAAVWLLDETGDRLSLVAGYGLNPATASNVSQAASWLHREALFSGLAAIEDASADPGGADLPRGSSAALCVALVATDRPLGTFCVYDSHPRKFSPAEVELLAGLARIGETAIPLVRRLAELEEAETQRAKLLRVTTHELRSPITVAQSLLRNVLRGYAGPLSEVQKDIFTRVSGQLDFLGTLVNDFLDLTASRAPARAADEGPVVLNVSLARVVLVLQPRADEKGITILFRQWREELAVWATEDALDHIFTNLVDNAVKYTPRDGRVTVALSQVGDQAQVIISDTGIGIPPESLPHLFEEFYRAPNARAFKAIGTGLGLAIVKGLVDRYRGKIAVESTVGQGTAFTVTFPLYIPTR